MQLGLFDGPPRPPVDTRPALWRAFMVTHLYGYTPQNPARLQICCGATYAETLREARAIRRGYPWGGHLQLEELAWLYVNDEERGPDILAQLPI